MKKMIATIMVCFLFSMVYAQADANRSEQLPSIIIKVSGAEVNDFRLTNTAESIDVPINDLSRQFIKPGSYTLSYKKWGYHKNISHFNLKMNDEKLIDFNPVPVSTSLIRSYDNSKITQKISLVTTPVSLGAAAVCKVLGDKEYKKYNTSQDANDISKYRKSSQMYQTAFFVASSVCTGSAVTWIASTFRKMTAKNRILAEMDRPHH